MNRKCGICTGCGDRRFRWSLSFAALILLLILLAFWNIGAGSVELPAREILDILFSPRRQQDAGWHIVWDIRLPRVLAAAVLGGALSVSGFLLQTFFANPIAGPFVLGISSGAKLAVSMVMIALLERGIMMSSGFMILAAFAGAMISMGFVLLISRRVRSMSMLVICGVMIGYICSAATDFAVTFADDANIVNLHNWSLGSFSGISWENVRVFAAVSAAGLILAFLLAKPMDAYQLGEVCARTMGVNIRRFRVELILLSSLLSACVTAFAGPVSFVGIAVPQLVKRLLKTGKPVLAIPGCFLGGAVFCLFCDLIARTTFAPTEISISSVTAVFGAPVVIYMMVRRRQRTEP
ncbi:MAG: iron ABC transporter permease [Eubacteriales bacterium]|nr:iron ABC transporter permease [Eubacteriales bacterium]